MLAHAVLTISTDLPFSGIAVSQAAFTFIYRFMSNKSAQNPEGVLNRNVLKTFFSINGTDANPVWTPGYNRIPDNWYKRNNADQCESTLLSTSRQNTNSSAQQILFLTVST